MKTIVFARGVRLLVPGILYLCASAPAWGETQKLTLPQVVEYSLQNNGDLKSLREEKGIRDAAKTRAGVLPNPTLELEGSTGALSGNNAENSLSLGISQEFIMAGKRGKRLAVAERELEMYRWQVADRERVLRQDVKTAFYDVVFAEQKLALSDSFTLMNRQLLDVTRARLEAGDIPELELNLVKVELARSEGAKVDAENTLSQNNSRLATIMGLSGENNPAITNTFEIDNSITTNLEDLKRIAFKNRPDLKVLEAEKSRGDADITLAKAEFIPNLTAGLNVARESTVTEVGGLEGRDTAYTVGLKLSIPIPLFDRNQSGVQEAKARRGSTDSRLSSTIKIIEREVETAYKGFMNAEKTLVLYRISVIPQLGENLKLTQEAYRLGEVGILTVIQEHKKFFEVNEGYLAAVFNRQTALIKLETSVATDITGGVK